MKGNYGNKRFLAKQLVFNQERMRMEEGLSRERLEACNANLSRSLTVHWGILVERWTVTGATLDRNWWSFISQSWLLTRPA